MNPATIIHHKFKNWWDSKVHFAFLIKDTGFGGLVFRYKDAFNYYYLRISHKGYEFCKCIAGVHSVIIRTEEKPVI